jgi:hypothetical protein
LGGKQQAIIDIRKAITHPRSPYSRLSHSLEPKLWDRHAAAFPFHPTSARTLLAGTTRDSLPTDRDASIRFLRFSSAPIVRATNPPTHAPTATDTFRAKSGPEAAASDEQQQHGKGTAEIDVRDSTFRG